MVGRPEVFGPMDQFGVRDGQLLINVQYPVPVMARNPDSQTAAREAADSERLRNVQVLGISVAAALE